MTTLLYLSNEGLAQLIRKVSENLNNLTTTLNLLQTVQPLRMYVEPCCHVGKGHLMTATEDGFKMQMEWFAGQLLNMVDNQQFLGINSWINCADKFTTMRGQDEEL